MSVSVVLCARNEGDHLSQVLGSISAQTYPISEIIVVDDGSTDATAVIAREFGAKIISLPYHKENIAGTPELAKRFNKGFEQLRNPDYVMIIGADDVFPSDYVEKLVTRMRNNPKLVIASGQIKGQPTAESSSRGSGRLIEINFFKKASNVRYPVLWCWEDYLLYKALSMGLETRGFSDIKFISLRGQVKRSRKKAYGDGRSMYALGYSTLYVMGRIGRLFLISPKQSINTLSGWIAGHILDKKSDIAEWVGQYQKSHLLRRFLEICKLGIK